MSAIMPRLVPVAGRPEVPERPTCRQEDPLMTTMFARHHVADYGAWRRAYDDLSDTQKRLGVVAQSVYQAADDPNDVTITHDFRSVEEAKAFASSNELHDAMVKAGVEGAPTIWFADRA